jgi:hypothetical protein
LKGGCGFAGTRKIRGLGRFWYVLVMSKQCFPPWVSTMNRYVTVCSSFGSGFLVVASCMQPLSVPISISLRLLTCSFAFWIPCEVAVVTIPVLGATQTFFILHPPSEKPRPTTNMVSNMSSPKTGPMTPQVISKHIRCWHDRNKPHAFRVKNTDTL